jgi:4-hydroxybenzoate polyprenyltransferase
MLAGHQFDPVTAGKALLAFIAFNLIASSVYLLNDLLDLSSDRAHKSKRLRPFANGTLPLSWGAMLVPGLLVAGFGVALLVGNQFIAVMAFYCVLTTVYSLDLKRRLIVDICTLAGLYTLRIVAGGVSTSVPISMWLLAFSIFFFFSLAAMKRQAELISGVSSGAEKAHGRRYVKSDLSVIANMAVASGYVSILVLALYLNSPDVGELYVDTLPLWGICPVLFYWISRMAMITHRGWMHDDPVVFAIKDRSSLICGLLVFAFAAAGAVK